jgi:hypothetical protein
MNLTDRELLARTIMAEAGNQGPIGMMGVGSVIMNRLSNPSYGNDFTSVILQPGQFSAWNSVTGYAGGEQGQNMSKIQPSEQAYMVADQILDGNYNDPTGGATHYYNPRISNPNWGQQAGGNWQQIGAHLFGVPGKKDPKRKSTMNANNAPLNAIPTMGPVTQNNAQPKANNQAKPPRRGLFDFLGKAVGNSFDGLKGAIDGSDPDKSDRLAIALMSLSGNPDQLQPLMAMAANDIQERKKTKSANKTVELIKSIDPKLGAMAEANPAMAGNIMSAIASKQLDGKGGQIMTAAQVREMFPGVGKIDEGLYNVKTKDGQIVSMTKVGGGGTTNEINLPGTPGAEEKLSEKLMTNTGEEWAAALKAGNQSAQIATDLDVLAQLTDVQPSGPLQGRLARLFPEFSDAAALRESIVKRIAPQLRVEGSGSTSDIEFAAMLNSYGSLLNTPEANRAILSVFQQKAAYNLERSKIIREYMTSQDPNRFTIANQKLEALEQNSQIPGAVQQLLSQYTDNSNPDPNQTPSRPRWNPNTESWE